MSARPSIPRLEGEELDLLISRALDGDLSPEETRDLETILAADPAARKRRDELGALVAEARALPAPAPPFALSTRVNSNVSEKASRGGSIFHRFGFYPPPGMAIGAMVVLGLVAVGITLMTPAPRPVASTIAGKADGPVDVFFLERARAKEPARESAKPAALGAAKPAKDASSETGSDTGKLAANDVRRDAAAAAEPMAAGPGFPAEVSQPSGVTAESKEGAPGASVASVVASNESSPDERQKKLAKSEADADAPRRRQESLQREETLQSPSLSAAAPQAVGGVSPAAPAAAAPAVRARKAADERAWAVAIRGEGARRWMLRRAPESRPLAASASASSFRVTLDADGRVTAARALDARPVPPALLEFVRGLVFAPVGGRASNGAGSLAEGGARDREKANEERSDALSDKSAGNPSEIEVEISTR